MRSLALLLFPSLAPVWSAPAAVPPQQSAVPGIGILEVVQHALESHPALQFQRKQVDVSRAIRQQRSAVFDTVVEWSAGQSRTNNPLTRWEQVQNLQFGLPADSQATNLTTLTGSAQRLLRSGIVVGPRIEMNRLTDNLQVGDGASRARLSFEIVVPLRRGKGRDVVTAPERAAQRDVEASVDDLSQTAAELVLSAAVSYWRYRGSREQLEIAAGSEERGRQYVESVETLIDADKLPRAEISQVKANFASRTAARISLQQQVEEARSAVALAMGLAAADFPDLPNPSDAFPDEPGGVRPDMGADGIRALIQQALKRRADFLAAGQRIQSADVLRQSARNGLLPQVDLTLSSGYSGLREGRRPDEFLAPPFTNARGPDVIVGLRYSIPRGNNLAQGRLGEAEAVYEQAVLSSSEKARAIAAGVMTSVAAVRNSLRRLSRAREAVAGYEAALEGEKDKLRLGIGSLIDLLTMEGHLTDALLDKVSAQMEYAIALAQYRFAGGTLVSGGAPSRSVERESFYGFPAELDVRAADPGVGR